jgi:hypothetical protein
MKKKLVKAAATLQVGLLTLSGLGPFANVTHAAAGNTPPNPPAIYSVADGQILNNTAVNIMFNYQDPEGNAQQSYELQRAYDIGFQTMDYSTGERLTDATSHLIPSSNQGDNYVRVRVKDNLGDWSGWSTVHYVVDSISPGVFTTDPLLFSNDPNGTYRLFAHGVSDNIAIKNVKFSSYYNGTWVDHGNGVDASGGEFYADLPKRGEGLHTINITAYDKAGNSYGPVTAQFRLDTIAPPAPTVTPSVNGWSKNDVTATITSGTDTNSGIAKAEYSLSGATILGWTTVTGPIAISNEGTTIISARSYDNAGNISGVTTKNVQIDKSAPASPVISANTTLTKNDVPVTIADGAEPLSGVKRTEYSLSGATIQDWTTYTTPFSITKDGQTTVSARTIDNLDNVSAISNSIVDIDKTAPTAPIITPSSLGWSKNDVSFTVAGSTDVHPITYEYKIGNGAFTQSAAGVVSTSGATTVTARAIDSVGNISPETTFNIKVDKDSPTIGFSEHQRDWDSNDIAVTINYGDALSGVDVNKRYFKVTQTPDVPTTWDTAASDNQAVVITNEGEWYIHAKVEDQVGNAVTQSSSYYRLQKQPQAPANLITTEIKESEASITWDLLNGGTLADGFQYEVTNLTTGQSWTLQYPTNTLKDTALQGGKSYQYIVRAVNHVGTSAPSQTLSVLTLPKAPQNIELFKVDADPSRAMVSFDPVESAQQYRLVATSPNNTVVYNQTVTGSVYQPVLNLAPGMNYTVSVSAINESGEGASNNSGFQSLPNIPGNFNSVTIQEDNVRLTWGTVTSATYYNVLRDGVLVYHGNDTMFQDIGLESGRAYKYMLNAENNTGIGNTAELDLMTLPAAVDGIEFSQLTPNGVTVNWLPVKGALNYILSINGSPDTVVIPASETSYTVNGLEPGTAFEISVAATTTSGSGQSNTKTGQTLPGAVSGLTGVMQEDSGVITWAPAIGATKYRITINGSSQEVSDTSLNVNGLVGSNNYPYTVEAGNLGGYGPAAQSSVLTKPHQPNNVHVTNRSETTVELSWDTDPTGITYTVVQDGVGLIATGPVTKVTIPNLSAAGAYKFFVRTTNASGESTDAVINWVSQPLAPVNVVSVPSTTTVHLNWDQVTGAAQYVVYNGDAEVYRGTEPAGDITGLSDGKDYTFIVKAINAIGIDSAGTEFSFKLKPKTPVDVTVSSKSSSSITLDLSKTQVVGADEYIIERDGKEIKRIPSSSATFTDSGLNSYTDYTYVLKASNATGVSDQGFEVKAKTDYHSSSGGGGGGGGSAGGGIPTTTPSTGPSSAPITSDVSTGSPGLSWGDVKSDNGFVLKRDGQVVYEGTEQNFTDINAEGGKFVYELEVDGKVVKQVEVTIPYKAPAVTPETSMKQIGDSFLKFEFPKVAGAEAYILLVDGKEVYRGVDPSFLLQNLKPDSIYKLEVGYVKAGIESKKTTLEVATGKAGSQPIEPGAVNFSDIQNVFNKDEIIALAKAGIIQGATPQSFEPQRTVNRAEYVALIVRMMRMENPNALTTAFTDVAKDDWFASVVATAVEKQFVSGVGEGSFAPNDMVTREQAAKIITNVLRTVEKTDSDNSVPFTDQSDISSWAAQDISYLVQKGLLQGYEDGSFKPKKELSRAEAAALIYRLMNYIANKS